MKLDLSRTKPWSIVGLVATIVFLTLVAWLAFDVGYDLARRPQTMVVSLPPGTVITIPPAAKP